ncbi:MAG: ferritin [Truepera sp.]|nr:ferritin [Truepera sp.]
MISDALTKALNGQIASEFTASNHYLAIATYFALGSLDGWADFFYRQSEEERGHGLKILQFLIDNDAEVHLPAVAEARTDFADALEAVCSALTSERKVSGQFDALAALATENRDYRSLQFLQWFISEQVEEEASMGKLVDLVKSGVNLFEAQQHLPSAEDAEVDAENE